MTVEVAAPAAVAGLAAGGRVDVLVSTEAGRTTVALARVELLALASGGTYGSNASGGAAVGSSGPTALATLRVTLRQAVHLTEADNFAREIRLLARPTTY